MSPSHSDTTVSHSCLFLLTGFIFMITDYIYRKTPSQTQSWRITLRRVGRINKTRNFWQEWAEHSSRKLLLGTLPRPQGGRNDLGRQPLYYNSNLDPPHSTMSSSAFRYPSHQTPCKGRTVSRLSSVQQCGCCRRRREHEFQHYVCLGHHNGHHSSDPGQA